MALYSNQLAQDYAEKRHNFRSTDEVVFSHIEKIGVTNKRILDFGCGDGVYVQEFLKRGASEIVGIDESAKMIEIANKKFNHLENTKFLVADGNNLPFENDVFDIVFANFVLHHFIDTLKPLKEIFRVLKRGGYFIATLGAYDIPENSNIPLNIAVPIRLGAGEDTVLVHNTLKSYKQVEEDLKNSGFKIEICTSINNSNARMDESHPYKDKVKLLTMFVIAKKPQ